MFLIHDLYRIPDNKPPTVYSLLNAIVNYGEEDKVKIKDLARNGRTTFFDFDYPLTTHINKEDFEVIILNHYMMRRIGYETLTAFKLQLYVKLNAIMPIYNKLFDMLDGWDLMTSGETVTRTVTDSNNVNSQTSGYNVNDSRSSNMPQGELENIRDGSYVSDYAYDQNNNSSNTSSTSNGNTSETINRSPADKIKVYKEFIENRESIYNLIFKELDSLFYGLV